MDSTTQFQNWFQMHISEMPPGSKLPTASQLATNFKISLRTVERYLKKHVDSGSIVRTRGKGSFVGGINNEISIPVPKPDSATRLVQELQELLFRGELKRGEALPPVKFICRQFKVSPATVTSAYRELGKSGLVTRIGRTFWVGSFKEVLQDDESKEVYIFTTSRDFSEVFLKNPNAYAYKKMEFELRLHSFGLRFCTVDKLKDHIDCWYKSRKLPYGVILYSFSSQNYELFAPQIQKLATPVQQFKPAILIDWLTGMPSNVPKAVLLLSQPHHQTVIARALAQYSVYKQFHGITLFINDLALPEQLEGIFYHLFRIRSELKRLSPHATFRIVFKFPSADRFIEWFGENVHAATTERLLSKYSRTTVDEVMSELIPLTALSTGYELFSDDSLLVFQSDQNAANCLEWAKSKKLSAGKDISVLSIEDNPAFYHLGLSRCVLDQESLGYMMAHAIIRDIPVSRSSKGFLQAQARIAKGTSSR